SLKGEEVALPAGFIWEVTIVWRRRLPRDVEDREQQTSQTCGSRFISSDRRDPAKTPNNRMRRIYV
ncbi:unnamed protein product, partial [Boreogadus saida]